MKIIKKAKSGRKTPEPKISLLIRFLEQNHGTLSKRALDKEFSSLKESEILEIEKKYKTIFDNKS